MIKVIENDILPESLMGRLLPLNTGHKNNPSLKEELTLRRLIQLSGFVKKTEPAIQSNLYPAIIPISIDNPDTNISL
jgi:hypothetical protein